MRSCTTTRRDREDERGYADAGDKGDAAGTSSTHRRDNARL